MSDESDSLSGTKHEALALIVKGMKVADAAERFGVSALTLSRWG